MFIQRDGLRESFGLHENAGVLELGVVFERAAVAGKRQSESERESALGVGGASVGLIDCRKSAEVLGIFVERDADIGRKARSDGEGLIVLISTRVGEKQATPAVE